MSAPIRMGTDGIRGPAGVWPLDARGARRVGRAVAEIARGPVAVAWDTRESGPALAEALVAGLLAGGVDAWLAGVLPTPALSCAVPALGAARGVMITASHNPWMDNGFKVLGPDGAKEPDEEGLSAALDAELADATRPGSSTTLDDAARPWRERLPRPDLRGARLLLDCAHGAGAPHAPEVLRDLGAELELRGVRPDGRNINEGVGALHPPREIGACDLAICLDGDADRLALVDREGPLDGDDLLWRFAGERPGPVVGTLMSNGGLEHALGGRLIRVPVGDRNVAEGMRASGAWIGAEPSGHVLFSDGLPTSCGLYTALRALAGGLDLRAGPRWARWPQALRNVRSRRALETLRCPQEAREAGNRVLVRYSGTEPLIRVLVEGPDPERWADAIAAEISS